MTVDIQESLITALYTRLTADTTLKTNMGGTVRCYLVWGKTDAVMPYLVHRIDMRAGNIWVERIGTYTLDIWAYSSTAEGIADIRMRIIELLDRYQFNTTEAKNVRLNLLSDGFIPESEPDIWHYSLLFDISLWRQSEAITILHY